MEYSPESSQVTDSLIRSIDRQSARENLYTEQSETAEQTVVPYAVNADGIETGNLNDWFSDINNQELGLNLLDLKQAYYWDDAAGLVQEYSVFSSYEPTFLFWDTATFLSMFFVAFIGGFGLNALSRLSGYAIKSVRDIFRKVE